MKEKHLKRLWVITAIILLSFFVISLQGCRVIKKNIQDKEVVSNKEKETETISEISTNKEINDVAEIQVSESDTGDEEFDKKVNKKVDEILSAINIVKKSGDNYYKMYYNLQERMMMMEAKIGETKESNNVKNTSETNDTTISEQLYREVVKTKWPWWVYALIGLFIWPYIKPIIMMLISPANALTPLQKLFNKT